jgi:hypothetical protein
MKAQLLIILLSLGVVTQASATKTDPKQEEKTTQKSKYDFNIFKLYSISVAEESPDSLKAEIKARPPKETEIE